MAQEDSRSLAASTVTGGLEAVGTCARGNDGELEVIEKSENPPQARTDPQEASCPKSDPGVSLGPRPVGSGSSIIVSPRQVISIEPQHLNGYWCENNYTSGIECPTTWSHNDVVIVCGVSVVSHLCNQL